MRSDRRLRFGHKIKVQGVQAVGAVGQVTINTGPNPNPPPSGVIPSITGVSRQVAGTAGGTPITVYGTNFMASSVVQLNGVNCLIRYYEPDRINFLTPPLPASPKTSGYTLTVTNGGSQATLANAIDILPTAANVLAKADFEDDTLGTWGSNGTVTVSTDFAYAGTKCAKMVSSGVDEDCLKAVYGSNPAFGPTGLLTHYRLLLPQSTIDNVNNAGTSGQIKLHLYRDFAVGADPTRKHGIVLGVGPQFRGNQLGCFFDWTNIPCSGTRVDGTAFTSGDTGLVFVANVWNEILLEQSTDGTTGRARLWLNGKRIVNQTNANMITGSNVNELTPYTTKIGTTYTENGIGPLTVYIDDAWASDGVPSDVLLGAGEGDIGYNPATDTLLKSDSMQYTVESASFIGPANNWHKLQGPSLNPDITPYTVTLDPTAGEGAYPIAVRCNLYSVQQAITNGTWVCSSSPDADAGIEGGMFGGTQMGDDAIGGQGGYKFWWSVRMKWPVGFRFSAFEPTVITPNCIRQWNYKTWLVFREAFGGAGGRTTFSSGIDRNGAELNGVVNVDWPAAPAQLWTQDVGPTSTSQKPAAGTSARYGQTMNNQLRGRDMTPDAVADGKWHTFVFFVQNESVEDAGDGKFKIYIDNFQIYDVDGTDPNNAAYRKAYTRVKAWKTCQWFGTINAGSIIDQVHWMGGPVYAWQRP
ncbi:MAG TPA: IPT/TIG domain-containing protein [Candidatus Paceibacterota bacterium]